MIKNDKWIKFMGESLLSPFEPELVRQVDGVKALSFGVGSYGYDIRLSDSQFKVNKSTELRDPKNINPQDYESVDWIEDETGKYFIIPPQSFGLGFSHELIKMPRNITGICIGKSTNERNGTSVHITPLEAGWQGYLVIEISNPFLSPTKVYCEGISQLLFLEGEPCEVDYAERGGKYQNQLPEVTHSRV